MIRIAAASYQYVMEYLSDNQGTYLDSNQSMEPFHGGKSAEYFGFTGEYDRRAFLESMKGNFRINGSTMFANVRYHHSGEKANEDGELEKTDPAIEVLVSPPKSWSTAVYFAKGEEKARLNAILRGAMEAAMERMETVATTRVTTNGVTVNEQLAGMSWTAFAHDSTRRGDMDSHFHVIVNKLALGLDGKVRSIDLASTIRIQYELDAYFKTELARLAAEAGYELRITANGPELEQIPHGVLEAFSSARTQIEAVLKDVGLDLEQATSNQKNWANAVSRLAKIQFNEDFIERKYRERLASIGVDYDSIKVRAERKGYTLDAPRKAVEAVYMGMMEVHEREDVIKSRHHLMLLAAKYSDFSIPADDLNASIDQLIASGELRWRVERNNGRISAASETLTSRYAIEREIACKEYFRKSRRRGGAITSAEEANAAIAKVESLIQAKMKPGSDGLVPEVRMTVGQQDMVHAALGVTHDGRITIVQGDPGTGKTTGMQAVRIAAQGAGWRVLGLAPSDKARDELTSAGVPAETVQLASKSEKWWKDVTHNTIIIIDEAGMIDSQTMNTLLRRAQAVGARIVAIGDTKQMLAVEAGTPFEKMVGLAKKDGNAFVEMTEMNRGRTEAMKRLHEFSRDDQAVAVHRLMSGTGAGKASFFSTKEEQYAYVADKVAALTPEERHAFAVVVDNNIDRIRVNEEVRARLGIETVFTMTSFEARNKVARTALLMSSTYEVGDAIRMNRDNDGFEKGDVLEVIGVQRGALTVRNSSGEVSQFNPDKHGRDATLGDLDPLALGKGDLIRIAVKWDTQGLRNGDRAIVKEIDANGLTTLDVIDVDGNTTRTVDVDLKEEGISVRLGYASTVNGLQGASIDHGIYLASSSNRNQFMVALTRFKHSVELVSDATTQVRLEALVTRVQKPQVKEPALPDMAEQRRAMRLKGFVSNAAWPGNREQQPGKDAVLPFPKKYDLHSDSAVEQFLRMAKEKLGENPTIKGNKTFVSRCQEVAEQSGMQDEFKFVLPVSKKATIKPAGFELPSARDHAHQAAAASNASRPRL